MKSLAKFTVAGITGVVLFKLFATILFPLLGLFFGILAMTVKLALIVAVAFFIYEMIRKRRPSDHRDDGEIEVDGREVEVDVEVED